MVAGRLSRFEVGCQSAGVGVVAASLRLSGRPRAHVGAVLFVASFTGAGWGLAGAELAARVG